ncbi:tyrosine-type recombinase/integrase [Herbaspirillum sp. ST 5-3]|uniref:tyrosine-type recombinase/integrase n=1 Tax=Herbaspirillum sp. ST 5-3 TaxID=2567936 RepID=UPI00249516E8|nr:tyrosine-type recombinase/integrase [Herbaspirillum sp. ST 5-3]
MLQRTGKDSGLTNDVVLNECGYCQARPRTHFTNRRAREDGLDGCSARRAASPHWLRHAYAKTLVVEHKVPLPVAQALLGHAPVQTTAAYAKTDLPCKKFEIGFPSPAPRNDSRHPLCYP